MGGTPSPSERQARELDELRRRRDRGERLTADEAARVGAVDVFDEGEAAMPPRVKAPREADKTE